MLGRWGWKLRAGGRRRQGRAGSTVDSGDKEHLGLGSPDLAPSGLAQLGLLCGWPS